nr:G-type lectin S-receptor-like serine/threonine-protein kinase At1g67520 [Ipomoea batatas]
MLHAGLISHFHVNAKDTLASGESLLFSVGSYLESSNTQYRLKFVMQPGGSIFSWYLCIQSARFHFQKPPEDITMWVTLLGRGQSHFPPDLIMSEEGQLIIYAEEEFIVNNQQPSYLKNTTATLLDNGNLVLRSGGRTLWQSFDYPTNTWLPGMKLGWFGLKTPRPHQRFLTSWTAQQNPSPGAFTFGVLYPNNTKRPQLVLMRRGTVYWQSGVWNGNNFSPIFPYLILSYFSDENQSYFVLNEELHFNLTYILIIDTTGGVTVEKDGYTSSSSYYIDCYNSEPTYLEEGCVRVKISNCSTSVGDNDWFNSTTGFIEEWEQYLYNFTFGITDCNEMCAKNCSCNAYASMNAEAGTGCKFSSSPAYNYASDGEALYIRHNAKPAPTEHSRQQPAGNEDEDLPFFNFKSIEMATNYFSNENKLGQGGFGPVYKVWTVWIEGRISELIDPTMDKTVSLNEAIRCIQVGLLCVQDSAADRPTMSDVVSMLGNELIVLPTPKQPGFSTIIGLRCDDIGNNPGVGSINMVTISDIEGR